MSEAELGSNVIIKIEATYFKNIIFNTIILTTMLTHTIVAKVGTEISKVSCFSL